MKEEKEETNFSMLRHQCRGTMKYKVPEQYEKRPFAASYLFRSIRSTDMARLGSSFQPQEIYQILVKRVFKPLASPTIRVFGRSSPRIGETGADILQQSQSWRSFPFPVPWASE